MEACRGNNANDHSNTVFEHEIDYNRTHRGLFPDWRSFGQLRVVPLRRVKRGSQASFVIYIRERCPHCGGETTARTGKNYDKNRRSAIRAHLQSCPRWLGHAALPRNRPIGKMMERQGTLTQTSLPWIARSQQPQCAESGTGSADSTDSAASNTQDVWFVPHNPSYSTSKKQKSGHGPEKADRSRTSQYLFTPGTRAPV